MARKKHRGRFQAQGDGLEESESWNQDEPLTKKGGLSLLNKLKSKLSSKDRKMREQQFEDAERFIKGEKEESGHRNGKLSRTEKQKMCEWISKFGADLPSLQ